jgi:hypothetical protein
MMYMDCVLISVRLHASFVTEPQFILLGFRRGPHTFSVNHVFASQLGACKTMIAKLPEGDFTPLSVWQLTCVMRILVCLVYYVESSEI